MTSASSAAPGSSLIIDVWAHLQSRRDEVLRQARAALRSGTLYSRSVGPVNVERGSALDVRIVIESLRYEDAAQIGWSGDISNCAFLVPIPGNAPTALHGGRVDVFANGLRIARLFFDVQVGALHPEPTDRTRRLHLARTAFASYASEDRGAVLGRVQGMQKVVPELDVFLDVVSLRSGERWQDRIESEIVARDLFYLFWSRHSMHSRYVTHEWHVALRTKGLDGIDPVPLVPPALAPPPPELAALHFNDWTLGVQAP